MRKVDILDNGANVLLDLLDLHGMGRKPRRGSCSGSSLVDPQIVERVAFRRTALGNSISRMLASTKYCAIATSRLTQACDRIRDGGAGEMCAPPSPALASL